MFADAGGEHAGQRLAWLLCYRGDLDGLRARADVGDAIAAEWLAEVLEKGGDLDGAKQHLRDWADAGRPSNRWLLGEEDDDRDSFMRARADRDRRDDQWLTALLERGVDLDEVETILRHGAPAGLPAGGLPSSARPGSWPAC